MAGRARFTRWRQGSGRSRADRGPQRPVRLGFRERRAAPGPGPGARRTAALHRRLARAGAGIASCALDSLSTGWPNLPATGRRATRSPPSWRGSSGCAGGGGGRCRTRRHRIAPPLGPAALHLPRAARGLRAEMRVTLPDLPGGPRCHPSRGASGSTGPCSAWSRRRWAGAFPRRRNRILRCAAC
jgi:hypothetical protein